MPEIDLETILPLPTILERRRGIDLNAVNYQGLTWEYEASKRLQRNEKSVPNLVEYILRGAAQLKRKKRQSRA